MSLILQWPISACLYLSNDRSLICLCLFMGRSQITLGSVEVNGADMCQSLTVTLKVVGMNPSDILSHHWLSPKSKATYYASCPNPFDSFLCQYGAVTLYQMLIFIFTILHCETLDPCHRGAELESPKKPWIHKGTWETFWQAVKTWNFYGFDKHVLLSGELNAYFFKQTWKRADTSGLFGGLNL